MKVIAGRKLPTDNQLGHDENGITKEKCWRNARANHLFQSISGSKAMDWNFQSVKYLHDVVQQYGGRKSGVEKQNSKKGFEKNEHACIVEGVLGFRIFCPSGLLRWPARLGKFKVRQSSDSSESD